MSKPNGSVTHARFQDTNRLALTRIESVLAHWLPGGKVQKREYVVKNPVLVKSERTHFQAAAANSISLGVW